MVPHVKREDDVERELKIGVCSRGTGGSKSGFLRRRVWVRTVEEIDEIRQIEKAGDALFLPPSD